MIQRQIRDKFLKSLSNVKYGKLNLTTPEGKQYEFVGIHPGRVAELTLHDWRVIRRLVSAGDIGFAEDYRDNNFSTKDLTALLTFALENSQALDNYIESNFFTRLFFRFSYLFHSNTITQAKRNIHKHYDLGNDFYKLWLDDSMTYSSAIFKNGNENLVEAQNNKYDRIIERIGSKGDILEIGCGWGGFMERAFAKNKNDYKIKAITLSNAQADYAKNRLGNHTHQANIAIEDYRKQEGKYNNIVSIEMFEAVGQKYWPVYFAKVKELLKPKGKAVIQTITIHDDMFDEYRKRSDMIRSFIFPGGLLPSKSIFYKYANDAGLRVNNTHEFGQDYSTTLDTWLHQFEKKYEAIKSLGFDEKFIQIWRFYLASCSACFKVKRTNVMQVELENVN